MASQGPNSPGTMADDATVGTVAWTNPDNSQASDNAYAFVLLGIGNGPTLQFVYSVKIVKGGTISGNEMTDSRQVSLTEAYNSYGSSTNLWGVTWTAEDINNSGFGVVFAYEKTSAATGISHYLKATNFGFTIPTGATIDGIVAEVEDKGRQGPQTSGNIDVDHIRITVYYTEATTGTGQFINIGDVWKTISALYINIGDAWKNVNELNVNIGDAWKVTA